MSEDYHELKAQFDAIKAKNKTKVRNAILEDCATKIEGLGIMRKMWTAAEMAAYVRKLKE